MGMLEIPEKSRPYWIIAVMGCLSGIVLLDQTILGVALPNIQSHLGLSTGATHWVVNAYFLALTCLAALGGKLADMFGLRALLLVSAPVFAAAALLAGFAPTGGVLIAMQALQGASAAFIFALSQAGANMAVPPEKRGLGIGLYAAITTIFLVLGPFVGGMLTHFASWHWVFWFNIPVALTGTALAFMVWRNPGTAPKRAPIDGFGVLLMLSGLGLLVFALMQGESLGWTSPLILGAAVIAIASLALFDRHERRHPHPLIDVRLFRVPAFSAAITVYFMAQYSLVAFSVFFPIFVQQVMHFTAAQAGLAILPAVIPFPLLSLPVGRLADKYGSHRVVTFGATLVAIVALLFALAIPLKIYPVFAVLLVLWGIGMVCMLGPSRRVAVNAAPADQQGQLSGTIVTLRLLGTTMGVAGSSAVLAGSGYVAVFILCGLLLLATAALAFGAVREPKPLPSTQDA
ncbi:MFS transporter [Roseibium sp. RKSG952]|uniref:MFS transporter n=1 Tax=Roseibium sp. RKSG952 TaxID=2529384 RepID=UPI0012BCA3E3|nr:MFS transporter [Roseibium sp. RKSG952]MTH95278.1 MFS transporter [Roseibium sp. RKSG952]